MSLAYSLVVDLLIDENLKKVATVILRTRKNHSGDHERRSQVLLVRSIEGEIKIKAHGG